MSRNLKTKEEQVGNLTGVNRKAAQLRQLESERRKVAEALRQSETMFRKITEKSIVGVYLIQEALAKPLGNEGRHGPVELRGVVFLTESIVASVL